MQPELNLSEVSSHFTTWRSGRRYRTEAIPQKLWDEALSLYPRYSKNQIAEHLKLPAQTYRRQFLSKYPGFEDSSRHSMSPNSSSVPSVSFFEAICPRSESGAANELRYDPKKGSLSLHLGREDLKDLFIHLCTGGWDAFR